MDNKKISRKVYDYLLRHIRHVEEAVDALEKEYFFDDVTEGINFKNFISDYISSVRDIIDNATIDDCIEIKCPFVVIGSVVEVEDLDDNYTCKYLITLPFTRHEEVKIDQASCLSPLGRALLLRRLDEKVDVRIPAGKLNYVIRSIHLPEIA